MEFHCSESPIQMSRMQSVDGCTLFYQSFIIQFITHHSAAVSRETAVSHNAILNLLDSKKLIAVGHLHCHFDEYLLVTLLFCLS